MHRILLLNGPNLNLLGQREPDRYGTQTLASILARCNTLAEALGVALDSFQSNHEGALVDRIHTAGSDGTTAIVINAGAYTHTSVALRDALIGVALPFYEVHLSNVHAREAFRHRSLLADVASGVLSGLGADVYPLAIRAACGRAVD
ncbi:type II 3-dehydroquinate dehydratase [Algiphilus sp.]|uniref:type II 3-dehydroquinate dehydratase n=1 Tax=Algiphilus sp. TaxID=1872431 RepID=UPI0032EB1108